MKVVIYDDDDQPIVTFEDEGGNLSPRTFVTVAKVLLQQVDRGVASQQVRDLLGSIDRSLETLNANLRGK